MSMKGLNRLTGLVCKGITVTVATELNINT